MASSSTSSKNSKIRELFRDLYKMDRYRPSTDEELEKIHKKNDKRIKKNKKPLPVTTHVKLRHDEPLPLVDIAKKRFKDSPYEFTFTDVHYPIPDEMQREEITKHMIREKISTCSLDYLFWDVQFHAKGVRSVEDMFHDRTKPNIHRIHSIFNNSFFGLTWIYPLRMKIIFDSLYHLSALLREMALYWSYPDISERSTTGRRRYMDFMIEQKSNELCSERFNRFFEEYHRWFLVEYMYRHYQRWERYPLHYPFIFDKLVRFFILFVFDGNENLFDDFMKDDKHRIPIKYHIEGYDLTMRAPSYKNRNTSQYDKINPDHKCNTKQREFNELMTNFKKFLREYCIPHHENQVVTKLRNAAVSPFKCYDLSPDKPGDTLRDVSIVHGKTDEWLNKYKFMIPVTSEWLHQVKTKKIVNHGHVEIIFWNEKTSV